MDKANDITVEQSKHSINREKILFVSDGGWDEWDGETLYKNGIGGSETFTIKYAEWLQKNNKYNVVVCCRCRENKVWNGVNYIRIQECAEYVKSNFVNAYAKSLDVFGAIKMLTKHMPDIMPINIVTKD